MPLFLTRILISALLSLALALSCAAQDTGNASDTPPATEPAAGADDDNGAFRAASTINVDQEDLRILMVPMTADVHAELAKVWQTHLRKKLEASATLKLRLRYAEAEGSEHLRNQIVESQTSAGRISHNYQLVLDSWALKGAKDEEIQPHRDYIFGYRAESVRTSDVVALLTAAKNWLLSLDGGLSILLLILSLAVAIYAMRIVAVFFRSRVRHRLDRIPHFSELLKRFVLAAVYWFTFMLGIVMVLGLFGIPVSALIGIFGGVGFIIGFALKDTLGNLASGLMIMVLKPFDLGDYIQVAGVAGIVDDMNIVSTRIRTYDNQLITVPNSSVWGDVITNVNAAPTRRVDLMFRIDYKEDTRRAMDVLRDLVDGHDKCLKDPAPAIYVSELAENSVNILCRPWTKTENLWTVYWDLTLLAKERFDAEGISIPLPHRNVHIVEGAPGAAS